MSYADTTLLRLRHFLQQPLPAEAIRWQTSPQSRQLLPTHAELRRSKGVTQTLQANDMIDWAQSTLEPKTPDLQRDTTSESQIYGEREVFIARWLNCESSFPLLSFVQERQRRSSIGQNGKRKKQLEIGELLQLSRIQRLPTMSVASPSEASLETISTSATSRSYGTSEVRLTSVPSKDRISSPVTSETPRERLVPVGGTTKILCHASAFVDPLTYVFGGLTQHGCSDTIWSLDPFEGGWRRVVERHERHSVPTGFVPGESPPVQRPCRRYNHTVIGWRHFLVVYGGDGAPGYLDDLWYFDTLRASWDRISLLKEQKSSRPGARAGHSASLWGNQMIVFGGWRGSDGFCDVWSCDLERREWNLLSTHVCCLFETIDGAETDPLIEGYVLAHGEHVPVGRHWHVAAVWNDYLYVHGGYGFSGVLKSLWRFDLVSHKWEIVRTSGAAPVARCRHSAAIVDQGRWILVGGKDALGSYFNDIFIFDFVSSTWQQIELLCPPAGSQWWNNTEVLREFPTLHCQACAYDARRGVLVITGGCDGECVSYDSTILIKRSSTASLLFDEWSRQAPRSRHALPSFIHSHPKPYSHLMLQFL